MPRIVRNTLLNYIPNSFEVEGLNGINPARIFTINDKSTKTGIILYLCEREIRVKDNFALQFAIAKSKELNLPLKIVHPKVNYEHEPKQNFINNQINQVKKFFQILNLDFEIAYKTPFEIIKNMNPSLLILDFNPIIKRNYLKNIDITKKCLHIS